MRAIRLHDKGSAVEDVQKRLRKLGYGVELDGQFEEKTLAAVRAFRAAEGLDEGDAVDEAAWQALVDATYELGDRLLYLRMPYFQGSDVASLQNILEVLGFVVGDEPGVFGAHTEHALREFQSSVGLDGDGIAGTTTFDAIERLRHAWEGKSATAAQTHEYTGFARAAEALQRMEACFYGMDASGREIASRMANLAHATISDARVTSAETLGNSPSHTMLMAGISTERDFGTGRIPVVTFAEDRKFSQRLRTAIESAEMRPRRIVVDISAFVGGADASEEDKERAEQHVAVMLLDAFCMALG